MLLVLLRLCAPSAVKAACSCMVMLRRKTREEMVEAKYAALSKLLKSSKAASLKRVRELYAAQSRELEAACEQTETSITRAKEVVINDHL